MRSLVLSLIVHGRIQTTITKARELRPFIERLLTRAKTPTLQSRRLLQSRIGSVRGTAHLINTIAPKYKDRQGGYTRIAKLGKMRKDGSSQAIIEFV